MGLAVAAPVGPRHLARAGLQGLIGAVLLLMALGASPLDPLVAARSSSPRARLASLLSSDATLTGPASPTSSFGGRVAISKDGGTAVIGGEDDNEGRGAVWVFTRSGLSWVQRGAKLTPRDFNSRLPFRPAEHFGTVLAVSADGNTVLVGDGRFGVLAAWVFLRTGGVWHQQGPSLSPRVPQIEASGSEAVALSGDGRTAVITGTVANAPHTWVYVWTHGHWRAQGRPLSAFGQSAALSSNGNTLLLANAGEKGEAVVFVRSGSRWSTHGRVLSGSGVAGFGSSAALSADGSTALVGNGQRGYALLYRRSHTRWLQIARLSSPHPDSQVVFGSPVALSSSGNTALIGASPRYQTPSRATETGYLFTRRNANRWVASATFPGLRAPAALAGDGATVFLPPSPEEPGSAAHIFTRAGAMWQEQSPVIAPSDATGSDSGSFGGSFALSADGNTALVAEGAGAWVFARSAAAGSWARQTELQLQGSVGGDGTSVALSADGNVAVLAGPSAPGPVAAWAFTRTGTGWSAAGAPLIASGASPRPPGTRNQIEGFATSVAISADGGTVLVGANWDTAHTGAAWVFSHSAAGWSQQGPKLTASSQSSEERFGQSVALSTDGNTALIGAPENTERPPEGNQPGAASVFTRSAGAWSQTAKLTDDEKEPGTSLGSPVALSADGNTALLGARYHALIFTRTGSAWQQHDPPLTAYTGEHTSIYGGPDAFGDVAALSADGTSALIGGLAESGCGRYMNNPCSSTATVWAFRRQGETWIRQPGALVRQLPFGSPLALSANGETSLLGGVTSGPTPGGAVLVSQLTPPPTSGFVTEATTTVYYGTIEQQLWSATPATYHATARVASPLRGLPLYGTATATTGGGENLTLTITPRPAMKRYLTRHKHLTLTITIQGQPTSSPPTTKTLTVNVKLIKPQPAEL